MIFYCQFPQRRWQQSERNFTSSRTELNSVLGLTIDKVGHDITDQKSWLCASAEVTISTVLKRVKLHACGRLQAER